MSSSTSSTIIFLLLAVTASASNFRTSVVQPFTKLSGKNEFDSFDESWNKIKSQTGISYVGGDLNTYNKDKVDSDKHMSALEIAATTKVGAMNNCQNCVYVLERIKQGYQYLLPSICVEIYSKEGFFLELAEGEKAQGNGDKAYAVCHEVLASLSVWGNNVRHWLHYGCYKAESYGAMELIRPCPSHIICSQMADFKKKA